MKPYAPIKTNTAITQEIKNLINLAPDTAWIPYYNFSALSIPNSVLYQDPLFQKLAEKHDFQAGVLRLPPSTCYNWHVDTDRGVSINMLLEDDGQSRCLFLDGKAGVSFKFIELKYQPNTYYAFNTKIPHTVLNFSTTRYLFSVEFLGQSRGLSFLELLVDIEG